MSTTPATTKSTGTMSIGCAIFAGLFWSAITLTCDGLVGWAAARQTQATGFPTTSGRITQSSVESHRGGKGGTSYNAKIKYAYQVAGKNYVGDRYRFGQVSSSDGNARRIVDSLPVGRTVDVFYSPNDPSIAVLKTGLEGMDLFLAMLLMPFNLIMLGIWSYAALWLWRGGRPALAGGAKVIDDGYTTRVRLSEISPFMAGAVAVLLAAFLASFVVAFASGFHPSLGLMYAVWGAIAAVGLIAFVVTSMRAARGDSDLLIEDAGRRIVLPATFGRTEAIDIPARSMQSVEVERIETRGSKGRTNYRYAPLLVFSDRDGSPRREKLAEWSSEANANALAGWLRDRLQLRS